MNPAAASSRLYCDNAATSFPKPPGVADAMLAALTLGGSAGRGSYREGLDATRLIDNCRRRLAQLFNAPRPESIVFGCSATDAINTVLFGMLAPGDEVVTSTMEHNAVARPLTELERRGVRVRRVPADATTGRVDAGAMCAAITNKTTLVALQHASNVSGTIQPVEEVAAHAAALGVPLLVDAAQTAGSIPIDVQALKIPLLAFPGHKCLQGPLGTGGLCIAPELATRIRPLRMGGTGSVSESTLQPETLPDRFESGSPNFPGLAGLGAAVEWVIQQTPMAIAAHERALTRQFLSELETLSHVRVIGPTDESPRVAVVSLVVDGIEPAELGALLESEFGILTRSGLHCAPWAHETLGTLAGGGTTRFSFGPTHTPQDVQRCVTALASLAL